MLKKENVAVIDDFNYDAFASKKPDYLSWLEKADFLGLEQLINKPTWSRIYNDELRESILDHVYAKPELEKEWTLFDSNVGYHLGIIIDLNHQALCNQLISRKINIVRDWSKYSGAKLCQILKYDKRLCQNNLDVNDDLFNLNLILTQALQKLAPEVAVRQKECKISWSPNLIRLKRRKITFYESFDCRIEVKNISGNYILHFVKKN